MGKRRSFIALLLTVSLLIVASVFTASAAGKPTADEKWKQGFDLYRNRKYGEAIVKFDEALALDSKSFRSLNGKGICLAFLGRRSEGLRYISKALEINPDYENGYFNQALAYELSRMYADAIRSYDKALELVATNAWSYYGQACSYGMLGDGKKAAERLRKAVSLDPATKESARKERDLDRVRRHPDMIRVLK